MVREKVKAKRAKLSQQQRFSLEEEDCIKSEKELMELYEEEQSKENANENIELLEDMLDTEDRANASALVEEYSQRYDQDEEMAQCVPELLVFVPEELQPATKVNEPKQKRGPRVKVTPARKEQKIKKEKIKNASSVSPHLGHSESSDQDDFPKAKKEGTWIQCSRIDCLKWRKLPNDTEPNAMPDRWVCAMNPDPSRKECSASQETCDSEQDFDVVYTPYVAGSLVWAKVPGYPWWPGMVEDDPDYKCCYETDESNVNPISYHVSFIFDKEVSRSWVSYVAIRSFSGTENPNENGQKQKKYAKSLSKALAVARKAMNLSLRERITKFSFSVLYKGKIGYQMEEKPQKRSKIKKKKPAKTSISPEVGSQKKTKTIKQEKTKAKRSSLTDSEQSCDNTQNIIKNKVKKRKRVLASSDEEDNKEEKYIVTNEINSDSSIALSENSHGTYALTTVTLENKNSSEVQVGTKDKNAHENSEMRRDKETEHARRNNSQSDKKTDSNEEEKREKHKAKTTTKKHKPTKLRNEAPAKKKKRKSNTSDEGEKLAPGIQKIPSKTISPDTSKIRKKKIQKSEGKLTSKSSKHEALKLKKKPKFVKPVTSERVSNEGDVSESSLDEHGKDTSTDEKSSHVEEPDVNLVESENQSKVKEQITSNTDDLKESTRKKKPTPFKAKKKKITEETSTKDDQDSSEKAVVKPKKFELSLACGKKTKPSPPKEKKIKKIKKPSSSMISKKENKARSQHENARANPSEITLEGSSVKTCCTKTISPGQQPMKTTSKAKKTKLGKFTAPVKTCSRVTPAKELPDSRTGNHEKFSEKSEKTLEEVLEISASDDPRKNPENYVNIDSLEEDISNLYQELSERVTDSADLMTNDDDITEASDCVTVEFLDDQISGNTARRDLSARLLTDSPEF